MHAAAGEVHDLLDRVAVRRIDHVGGPEHLGQVQLRADHVHGDDAAGAGDGRAVDRRQADPAAADHRHGFTSPHIGRLDHRADAGGHRAADQGGAVQGHVLAHGHAGVLVDQHLFGEGGQVEELVHAGRGLSQAGFVALGPLGVGADAQGHVPGQAVFAMAAIGRQAGDHVVARLHRSHFRPYLFDHASALVAQHGGQGIGIGAFVEMQVGVADPGGDGADQDLVRAGLVDLHVLDFEGCSHLAQNSGFHPDFLLRSGDPQPAASPAICPAERNRQSILSAFS